MDVPFLMSFCVDFYVSLYFPADFLNFFGIEVALYCFSEDIMAHAVFCLFHDNNNATKYCSAIATFLCLDLRV